MASTISAPTQEPPLTNNTTQPQEQEQEQHKQQPAPSHPFTQPPLPAPFTTSPTPLHLLAHGAEALLYKTTFLTPHHPCILKHRPRKSWRHPTLDTRLTRHRILAEARILVRCRREKVPVPAVLALDAEAGWLCTEFIESGCGVDGRGLTVREGLERWRVEVGVGVGMVVGEEVRDLLRRVGAAVAGLHAVGVVHGDLTSSNVMLRSRKKIVSGGDDDGGGGGGMESERISLAGEVVLIDFGLASTSVQDEDRAVDLYVLERAMGSTHPWLEEEFGLMWDGYRGSYKGANVALKRLEDVRMRGRKKSMLG